MRPYHEMVAHCESAGSRFILCSSLPFNENSFWPLICPTHQLTLGILEHFKSLTDSADNSLYVGPELYHQVLKMHEPKARDPECEYCGVSHAENGRCASCGAPSKFDKTGGWRCIMGQMPRYDFDPVLGYISRPHGEKSYGTAQYEVVCFGSQSPRHRKLLMVCRVAKFAHSICY